MYKIIPVTTSSLVPGIYRLHRGKKIVYVGSAHNIPTRIYAHLQEGIKDFDGYSFDLAPVDELLDREEMEVLKHAPEYNQKLRSYRNATTIAAFARRLKQEGKLVPLRGIRKLKRGAASLTPAGNMQGYALYWVKELEAIEL